VGAFIEDLSEYQLLKKDHTSGTSDTIQTERRYFHRRKSGSVQVIFHSMMPMMSWNRIP
jgi:hypothetical protein